MVNDEPLVTVIIPTYNRFNFLRNAIESVKKQTYKNVDIIVINDASTHKMYHQIDLFKDVFVLNLDKNSKSVKGYACAGYVRNHGLRMAIGEYIAFLDDDDYWLPNKLKIQIGEMRKKGSQFSCTDRYNGKGVYDPKNKYRAFMTDARKDVFLKKMGLKDLPNYFTKNQISKWNYITNSSVIIHKDLFMKVGLQDEVDMKTAEDRLYWLRCLNHTNCLFVKNPLVYYDMNHGNGQMR